MSQVRENLMSRKGYSPYCGNDTCHYNWPRTLWIPKDNQFKCACGWKSQFPEEFISQYKEKWNK